MREIKLENETIKLYELTELESMLGISHRTLLDYVNNGTIKAVKMGGRWKVTEENLKRYLNGD